MDYNKKYIKYKSKYNDMKGGQIGGGERNITCTFKFTRHNINFTYSYKLENIDTTQYNLEDIFNKIVNFRRHVSINNIVDKVNNHDYNRDNVISNYLNENNDLLVVKLKDTTDDVKYDYFQILEPVIPKILNEIMIRIKIGSTYIILKITCEQGELINGIFEKLDIIKSFDYISLKYNYVNEIKLIEGNIEYSPKTKHNKIYEKRVNIPKIQLLNKINTNIYIYIHDESLIDTIKDNIQKAEFKILDEFSDNRCLELNTLKVNDMKELKSILLVEIDKTESKEKIGEKILNAIINNNSKLYNP